MQNHQQQLSVISMHNTSSNVIFFDFLPIYDELLEFVGSLVIHYQLPAISVESGNITDGNSQLFSENMISL